MGTPEDTKLRTVHINTARSWSGGEVQTFNLVKGLHERGHDPLLITPPESPLLERTTGLGIRTESVSMRGEWDLPSALKVRSLLKKEKPDVLHMHTSHAHTLGIWAAKPAFVKKTLVTRRMDYSIKGLFSKLKYRKADHIAAISTEVKNVLVDCGMEEKNITIIHSSIIPPVLPKKSTLKKELGWDPEAPLIGTAASLHERKGLKYLITAYTDMKKEVPRLKLVIAGEGPQEKELKELVERIGMENDIRFLGFRKDMPNILAALDVFILPSLLEGLGVALLEASGAGVPVVASNTGGIPDVVDDGKSGFLVPPGDSAALTEKILKLLKDKRLREVMGQFGKDRIEKEFSADLMVKRYIELYEKLLKNA